VADRPSGADNTSVLEIVFSAERIAAAVESLATRIRDAYAGEAILFVGVLKGAAMFAADLMRALGDHAMIVDFMVVTSYGTGRTSGSSGVRILKDLDEDPKGRHVLLVEDIVDEGLTLRYLLDNLRSRGPASLRACTLLSKPFHRRTDVTVDFVGLDAPDAFLVGYGLDHQERFRNLPYICKLQTSAERI
jgi:hypoxanthine phosphoribosyltransferase